jgi:gluconolactonase
LFAQEETMKTTVMPKSFFVILFLLINLFVVLQKNIAQQANKPLTVGGITYLDSSLLQLLPRGATIEIIGSGYKHIEGPLWIKDSSMLLFSDTKARIIYRWQPVKGTTKFLQNAGFTGRMPYSEEPGTNGLVLNQNGELIVCEHGDRKLSLYPMNGKYGLKTLTDNFEGKRYNSPNDVIQKSDGTIYFTDPPYGLPLKEKDGLKEAKSNGVYSITKEGGVKLLIDSLVYPNGLAFTPDEQHLYVAVSDSVHPHILIYDVKKEGTLSNGKLFFDASSLPREDVMQRTDGLKIDTAENVWSSGPGGLLIINKEGKLLGIIHTGEIIANCAWGDDGSTLYFTGNTFLYRIETRTKGVGF